MKKCVVFILAVLYIGSSTGATIHLHYCMGKLVNMSLSKDQAKKCPNCPGEEKNGSCSKDCCKDLHKTVKLEKDQKPADTNVKLLEGPSGVIGSFCVTEPSNRGLLEMKYAHPYIKGPPAGFLVHPYILFGSFRV